MMSSILATIPDTAEKERFVTDAHHIEDFASAYEPEGRGLLLFSDRTRWIFLPDPKCMMLFRDAKDSLTKLLAVLK